jgi:hypothetical protein
MPADRSSRKERWMMVVASAELAPGRSPALAAGAAA